LTIRQAVERSAVFFEMRAHVASIDGEMAHFHRKKKLARQMETL
jgi:hypothetical protein